MSTMCAKLDTLVLERRNRLAYGAAVFLLTLIARPASGQG